MFIPILITLRTIASLLYAAGLVPGGDLPTPTPTPPAAVHTATTTTSTTLPAPAPAPADDAEPGKLVVDTNDIDLAANVYSGSFELTNTGGEVVEWEWIRGPEVHTASPSGTLAPGETTTVHFELDPADFVPGENLSATCVAYDGGAVDVWITATKVVHGGPSDITS